MCPVESKTVFRRAVLIEQNQIEIEKCISTLWKNDIEASVSVNYAKQDFPPRLVPNDAGSALAPALAAPPLGLAAPQLDDGTVNQRERGSVLRQEEAVSGEPKGADGDWLGSSAE